MLSLLPPLLLPLTRQLIAALEEPAEIKSIELTPDNLPQISTVKENNTIAVGLTKKTYLALFKEAHTFWHHHENVQNKVTDPAWISTLSEDEKWTWYYVTVAFLTTTNENHTMFRLHEMLVNELGNSANDFEIITSLATSRLKRINKSSSLWHYIAKLTVELILEPENISLYRVLLARVSQSLQLHFGNYYASTFLKWLIRINHHHTAPSIQQFNLEIFELLRHLCKQSLKDPSLWTSLQILLDVMLNLDDSNSISYAINLYQETAGENHHVDLTLQGSYVSKEDVDHYIIDIIDWLIKVDCIFATPYLKIRQLQKEKQKQEAAAAASSSSHSNSQTPPNEATVKVSAAQLRLQKDITALELPPTIKVLFPDPSDLFNFDLSVNPQQGYYKSGIFQFKVEINQNFPIEPPKIKCLNKIYHPNIDLEGNVCLNILREDWSPVLSLNSIFMGINFLFLEPNPNDPLNKDAANVLVKNKNQFTRNVRDSMRGGYIDNEYYDRVV